MCVIKFEISENKIIANGVHAYAKFYHHKIKTLLQYPS